MITAISTTLVTWILLLGLYYLLFARQTFFQWNRIYLLSSLAFGLILPWISLPAFTSTFIPTISNDLASGLQSVQNQMEEVVIIAQGSPTMNWWHMLIYIVMIGALVRFCRFGYGIWQIARYTMQSEVLKNKSYWLVKTKADHLPFSFFNAIYWGEYNGIESFDEQVILKHEQVHLKQGHSWDILALEILLIVFWWFPPLYLFKKEIRQLHEYLADEATLKNISRGEYKNLLLKYIMPGRNPLLTHAFSHFQLKKRLIMMSKQPSDSIKKVIYLAILPVVFIFMSFKPTIPTFDLNQTEVILNIGDPIDEATVKKALAPALDKIMSNPENGSNLGLLTKHLYSLTSQYPGQESEIFNIAQRLVKGCESGVYLAKVDGRVMAKYSVEGKDVYDEVDVKPEMPGCENLSGEERKECGTMKLLTNLYSSIRYPKEARDNGNEGTVVCRFIITEDGSVDSPEIIRSVAGGCDEEVVRVIKDMKFNPGMLNGKKVKVSFTLPVKFKLEDNGGDGQKKKENKN